MRRIFTLLTLALLTTATLSAQQVKNIIYLIGDGMGLASVSMMQLENKYEPTVFDRADNIALQKTYSADNRVTDSAASGTALATGSKTNNTFISVTPDGKPLESLMELAATKGMATGLVVTTYIQHATPAVFYAHHTSRHAYTEISRQLLDSHIDVAIGGGMAFFDELYGSRYEAVAKPLIALLADKEIGANSGDYLATATREALRLLDARDNDNGFVLMVEGSLIDGMGHGNDAEAQQLEMQGFMDAIEAALAYAESNPDTLVVVTADHETGGLSLVSGNADFNLSEQGVEYRWTTNGHSGVMIPIYLYGKGAELINGVIENAELGSALKAIIANK